MKNKTVAKPQVEQKIQKGDGTAGAFLEAMKEFHARHPVTKNIKAPTDLSTNYKKYLYGEDFR